MSDAAEHAIPATPATEDASVSKPKSGKKHKKAQGRYHALLNKLVNIPVEIFGYDSSLGLYFQARIIARNGSKAELIVKFPNWPDRYFFPIDDVERWLDASTDIGLDHVVDFATWTPPGEQSGIEDANLQAQAHLEDDLQDDSDQHRQHIKASKAASKQPAATSHQRSQAGVYSLRQRTAAGA